MTLDYAEGGIGDPDCTLKTPPVDVKFVAQGCGTETTCYSKPGTLVPSGSRLLTIKKTSCRPSSQASAKAK